VAGNVIHVGPAVLRDSRIAQWLECLAQDGKILTSSLSLTETPL